MSVHPRYLTPRQVAELLTVSEKTLANWRSTRAFTLPYVKFGGSIRYRLSDLENYILKNLVATDKVEVSVSPIRQLRRSKAKGTRS